MSTQEGGWKARGASLDRAVDVERDKALWSTLGSLLYDLPIQILLKRQRMWVVKLRRGLSSSGAVCTKEWNQATNGMFSSTYPWDISRTACDTFSPSSRPSRLM